MHQLLFYPLLPFILASAREVPLAPSKFSNVDLEYGVHAPTYTNSSSSGLQVATYANIRYAQPPIGNLRFRKAKVPPPHHDGILDGTGYPPTDCVSTAPAMIPYPPINGTNWGQEDCLFLDVLVPEGVKEGDNVPVVHWIHGGGFAFGSKDNKAAFPAGKIDSTYRNTPYMGLFDQISKPDEKFILVASNYRLGLHGFLSSPLEQDMDSNVGLHDSKTAIEWTKEYISRFGGDPEQITAIGESGGASLLTLMLTGNGGAGSLPFSQVILSSPGLMPRRDVVDRRHELYSRVLSELNCSSIKCLRNVSPATLFDANNYFLSEVPTESGGVTFGPGMGFGPVVDGGYIPDTPTVLFSQGRFHRSLRQAMIANLENEGMGLASDRNMPAAFPDFVRKVLPTASRETIDRIESLFPYPSSTPEKLAWDWLTAIGYACLSKSAAEAYKDRTRRYVMTIPPAIHAQDLAYIFYGTNVTEPVANTTLARNFQSYILDFIHDKGQKVGDLSGRSGLPDWPVYSTGAKTMNISEIGFEIIKDPWEVNQVCAELLKIVEDPENGV